MNSHNLRVSSIFFVFISLYLIVLANLYILQVRQANYFSSLGKQQYNVTVTQMPPRAEIFDSLGNPLAINKDNFSAFITPNNLDEPEKVKQFLNTYFPIAAQRFNKNKNSHFLYIKRKLTDEQVALINSCEISDIKLLKEPSRYYPLESIGPLVGITDIDNQGLFGIELMSNNFLAGKPTTYVLEKDARLNFFFKRETKIQGSQGQPVNLTIDSTLQFLAYEELKETVQANGCKEGSVLIMNPDNGEILVMANYPDFDPNNTEQTRMDLTKNRICTDAYELGSVIKIFLTLAALEAGLVTTEELIDCENSKNGMLNGFKFTTYKAAGIVTFAQVIENSNNIGVAKVAIRMGSKLYDHYVKLGFSKKIGIFPGENKGFITPPDKWSAASIVALSFGYEISATIMQLAQALGIVANDGYLIKPKLIKDNIRSYGSTSLTTSVMETPNILNTKNNLGCKNALDKGERLYGDYAINSLKEILTRATKIKIPGCIVMGKTGTARLITNGKYDPNRHVFTYSGIIEKGKYKRLIITFLKETTKKDGMASTIALPLFEKVAHKMLIHDKII